MNRPSDEDGLRQMLGGANDETDDETRRTLREAQRELSAAIDAAKAPLRIDAADKEAIEYRRATFMHLRLATGAATLAYRRDPDRPQRVFVGVALCSPADQYSRKRGRLIASGRLARVEALALDHETYDGLGFVFAAGDETHAPELETREAFESWISGTHRMWPLWLMRYAEEHQGCRLPLAPWAAIMSTRAL